MGSFAKEATLLLQHLIPGFVAAWIFYSFTSHIKPSHFERVIQALIFTFFIQFFLAALKSFFVYIGKFDNVETLGVFSSVSWSIATSVLFGFSLVYLNNNDSFHSFLRRQGLTQETPFHSVWLSTFHEKKTDVVLHFKDGNRLHGWPKQWPSEPNEGHFLIECPRWFYEERKTFVLDEGVDSILVDVNDIRWVEFTQMNEEG